MNTVKQSDIDTLSLEYTRKKREVERGLAEMRAIRKQVDLLEDLLVIEVMKSREQSKKEVLHA